MALKANEVRIGNLFYSTGRGYVALKGVSIDSDGNGAYTFGGNNNIIGHVTAIPLTKENITFFGFHKTKDNIFVSDNMRTKLLKQHLMNI